LFDVFGVQRKILYAPNAPQYIEFKYLMNKMDFYIFEPEHAHSTDKN